MTNLSKATFLIVVLLAACFQTGRTQSSQAGRFADEEAKALFAADPATYVGNVPYALEWTPIRETDVVWRKRIWRTVDGADAANVVLNATSGSGLLGLLVDAVQRGELKAYSNADDRFTHALTPEEFAPVAKQALAFASTPPTSPAKLFIKEDWIHAYDDRGLLVRIIGVAPVATTVNAAGTLSEQPLFWLYYPEVRPLLRKQAVDAAGVQNLDEWFEGRRFSSTVTKATEMQTLRRVSQK